MCLEEQTIFFGRHILDQFLNSKSSVKQNNVYNSHQILRYFIPKHPDI